MPSDEGGERARLAALRAYGILDAESEPALDELARLAAVSCHAPIAWISFVDETRQWFKARVGFDSGPAPRAVSFCAHAMRQRDIFTVPDAGQDARFAGHPLVASGPRVRFYAGTPLVTPDGHSLGALCVSDRAARPGLLDAQAAALRVLGQAVMAQLALRLGALRAGPLPPPRFELQAVLERVSDAVVALDRDGRYTFVNAQAGRLFGRAPADLLGRHLWTEFPASRGREFHLACEKALTEQRLAFVEQYDPQSDRWLESRIYPSPDGLTIYFHDVTLRKQGERLLTGQVEVLESISKGVPLAESLASLVRLIEGQSAGLLGAVLLLDADGRHLRLGAAPNLPTEYRQAIDGVELGPRAGAGGMAAQLRELVLAAEIAGDPRWTEWAALANRHGLRACWMAPIFDAGQDVLGAFAVYYRHAAQPVPRHLELIATATHLAAIAITRHRTESALRETAARLRAATTAGRIGIYERDLATDEIVCSELAAARLGLDPAKRRGTLAEFKACVHPDDLPGLLQTVDQAIAGRTGYAHEYRVIWPDGSVHWIAGRAEASYDETGRPVRVVGVIMDVTERKHAEGELVTLATQLRASALRLESIREEERTRMAREIHDVLAQDLTRVKLDLAWLGKRVGRPISVAQRPELIARVAETAAQTDAAIGTVQKIATELRPVILDRLGLAAALEWLAEDFARRTGIACRASVGDGTWAVEERRATALFRIAQESLTNVIRHAQATTVEIELVSRPAMVALAISDNGRGIRAAQINDARSIGLVGIRERATAFGGIAEFFRSASGGTTVAVRLPAGEMPKEPRP